MNVFNTDVAAISSRIREDGSIVPRRNFDKKDLHRVDLRLSKRFAFNNRFSFEPMVDIFNLFNRANFTDWVLDEQNARFGLPDAADGIAYQPRVIQVGFRARF